VETHGTKARYGAGTSVARCLVSNPGYFLDFDLGKGTLSPEKGMQSVVGGGCRGVRLHRGVSRPMALSLGRSGWLEAQERESWRNGSKS